MHIHSSVLLAYLKALKGDRRCSKSMGPCFIASEGPGMALLISRRSTKELLQSWNAEGLIFGPLGP